MPTINILLVEDHPMMRNAIKIALENQIEIASFSEATSLAEAKQLALENLPDLVLLDIYLPDGNGIDFLDYRNLNFPGTRIVVLTSSNDEKDMMAAFKAGADGFLGKDASPEQLTLAVKAALTGNRMLTSGAAAILLKNLDFESENHKAVKQTLTEKEKAILQKMAKGETSAMIAASLHITESTLRSHYHLLYKKTGVANRDQLIIYAVKHFS